MSIVASVLPPMQPLKPPLARFSRALRGAEPTSLPHQVRSSSTAGRAGPRRRITDEAAGSAGDCFCLGPAEAAFVPRAHPHRVRPANPALLARPGTSLRPTLGWAGSFPLPALCSRARTPPLTLHELHASGCSSAPVPESAHATSRACAPFPPQSLAIQASWVSLRRASGSRRPCPAASTLCPP